MLSPRFVNKTTAIDVAISYAQQLCTINVCTCNINEMSSCVGRSYIGACSPKCDRPYVLYAIHV